MYKIKTSMYYLCDEAGVPEIIRSWDCDHVFASETFLCSCCKGRGFLFEWISTVADLNLSLVKSVRLLLEVLIPTAAERKGWLVCWGFYHHACFRYKTHLLYKSIKKASRI